MQRTELSKGSPAIEALETRGIAERQRVETVVKTLSMAASRGESLAEVAHDARNMVTALGLYCDLLEEPGVLAAPFRHYGNELRLVAAASRRLVEKLVALDAQPAAALPGFAEDVPEEWPAAFPGQLLAARQRDRERAEAARDWEPQSSAPIRNLAAELMANRNLLAALAGPSVALTVDAEGGALPVRLNGEDLTRVLVNLVKNASEAMDESGRIRIALREIAGQDGGAERVLVAIEDNGPGIQPDAMEKIFESGYTSHANLPARGGWTTTHRGLGLAITRSIVEAAGGRITAAHGCPSGARLEIELPVWNSAALPAEAQR
jgi:two-component system sensor histidine kinase ChvG